MLNSVIWYGRSGTAYSFVVHPLDGPLDDRAGIYIFARQDTGDEMGGPRFASARPIVSRESCQPIRSGNAHGTTPRRTCTSWRKKTKRPGESAVRDLIARWHPPCNQTLADAICSREHAASRRLS